MYFFRRNHFSADKCVAALSEALKKIRNFQEFSSRVVVHCSRILTTQSDRCALTGFRRRYATYCTNEAAPTRDAKVDAPTNSTQHRRSAELERKREGGAAYRRQVQRYLLCTNISSYAKFAFTQQLTFLAYCCTPTCPGWRISAFNCRSKYCISVT